ncbi:hypothetical protein PEC301937_26030 [Pectobacterium carotovorum subsp. carotovorum]|nr:hypothetical protein PEC301937_26030 [Pectobacterium carotovorum subsp. carotovorum]
MNVIFPAAYYDASSEEGVLTVGFADSADDPQHFLILQRAEEPDEQDEELIILRLAIQAWLDMAVLMLFW